MKGIRLVRIRGEVLIAKKLAYSLTPDYQLLDYNLAAGRWLHWGYDYLSIYKEVTFDSLTPEECVNVMRFCLEEEGR